MSTTNNASIPPYERVWKDYGINLGDVVLIAGKDRLETLLSIFSPSLDCISPLTIDTIAHQYGTIVDIKSFNDPTAGEFNDFAILLLENGNDIALPLHAFDVMQMEIVEASDDDFPYHTNTLLAGQTHDHHHPKTEMNNHQQQQQQQQQKKEKEREETTAILKELSSLDYQQEEELVRDLAAQCIQGFYRRYRDCKEAILQRKAKSTEKLVQHIAAETITRSLKRMVSNGSLRRASKTNSTENSCQSLPLGGVINAVGGLGAGTSIASLTSIISPRNIVIHINNILVEDVASAIYGQKNSLYLVFVVDQWAYRCGTQYECGHKARWNNEVINLPHPKSHSNQLLQVYLYHECEALADRRIGWLEISLSFQVRHYSGSLYDSSNLIKRKVKGRITFDYEPRNDLLPTPSNWDGSYCLLLDDGNKVLDDTISDVRSTETKYVDMEHVSILEKDLRNVTLHPRTALSQLVQASDILKEYEDKSQTTGRKPSNPSLPPRLPSSSQIVKKTVSEEEIIPAETGTARSKLSNLTDDPALQLSTAATAPLVDETEEEGEVVIRRTNNGNDRTSSSSSGKKKKAIATTTRLEVEKPTTTTTTTTIPSSSSFHRPLSRTLSMRSNKAKTPNLINPTTKDEAKVNHHSTLLMHSILPPVIRDNRKRSLVEAIIELGEGDYVFDHAFYLAFHDIASQFQMRFEEFVIFVDALGICTIDDFPRVEVEDMINLPVTTASVFAAAMKEGLQRYLSSDYNEPIMITESQARIGIEQLIKLLSGPYVNIRGMVFLACNSQPVRSSSSILTKKQNTLAAGIGAQEAIERGCRPSRWSTLWIRRLLTTLGLFRKDMNSEEDLQSSVVNDMNMENDNGSHKQSSYSANELIQRPLSLLANHIQVKASVLLARFNLYQRCLVILDHYWQRGVRPNDRFQSNRFKQIVTQPNISFPYEKESTAVTVEDIIFFVDHDDHTNILDVNDDDGMEIESAIFSSTSDHQQNKDVKNVQVVSLCNAQKLLEGYMPLNRAYGWGISLVDLTALCQLLTCHSARLSPSLKSIKKEEEWFSEREMSWVELTFRSIEKQRKLKTLLPISLICTPTIDNNRNETTTAATAAVAAGILLREWNQQIYVKVPTICLHHQHHPSSSSRQNQMKRSDRRRRSLFFLSDEVSVGLTVRLMPQPFLHRIFIAKVDSWWERPPLQQLQLMANQVAEVVSIADLANRGLVGVRLRDKPHICDAVPIEALLSSYDINNSKENEKQQVIKEEWMEKKREVDVSKHPIKKLLTMKQQQHHHRKGKKLKSYSTDKKAKDNTIQTQQQQHPEEEDLLEEKIIKEDVNRLSVSTNQLSSSNDQTGKMRNKNEEDKKNSSSWVLDNEGDTVISLNSKESVSLSNNRDHQGVNDLFESPTGGDQEVLTIPIPFPESDRLDGVIPDGDHNIEKVMKKSISKNNQPTIRESRKATGRPKSAPSTKPSRHSSPTPDCQWMKPVNRLTLAMDDILPPPRQRSLSPPSRSPPIKQTTGTTAVVRRSHESEGEEIKPTLLHKWQPTFDDNHAEYTTGVYKYMTQEEGGGEEEAEGDLRISSPARLHSRPRSAGNTRKQPPFVPLRKDRDVRPHEEDGLRLSSKEQNNNENISNEQERDKFGIIGAAYKQGGGVNQSIDVVNSKHQRMNENNGQEHVNDDDNGERKKKRKPRKVYQNFFDYQERKQQQQQQQQRQRQGGGGELSAGDEEFGVRGATMAMETSPRQKKHLLAKGTTTTAKKPQKEEEEEEAMNVPHGEDLNLLTDSDNEEVQEDKDIKFSVTVTSPRNHDKGGGGGGRSLQEELYYKREKARSAKEIGYKERHLMKELERLAVRN